MRALNIALGFCLMLLILPWGAYSRQFGMAESGQVAVSAQPASAATVPSSGPRCHGPALPGLPCTLFLAPAVADLPLPIRSAWRLRADAGLLPRGMPVSPPERPPRFA